MQRYFAKNFINDKPVLYDSDIKHITKVMRLVKGDYFEVVYDKVVYHCKIENTIPFSYIIESTSNEEDKTIGLTVAVGLVQEQKMDLILQKLTELGVETIIPLKTERSIVKLDDIRFAKKLVRWQMICKEASEQSFRNVIPNITNVMTIDDLKNIDIDTKLVCSTKEKDNIINKYVDNLSKDDNIIFVIGPEGGLSINEEEKLNSYGYNSISLGNRILRVETATFFVASIINYINME
mgnify:FL=1